MPELECIPLFESADRVTVGCVGEIKGKRFVAPVELPLSGPGMPLAAQVGASDPVDGGNLMCATCPAGARALGVSTWTGKEAEKIGAITEGIVPVTAGENLETGEEISVGAEGKAVKAAATNATAASIEIMKVAEGNGIKLTAVKPGPSELKVIVTMTGKETAFTVKTAAKVMTINLPTNKEEKSTVTAAELIALLNANSVALESVFAANAKTSKGAFLTEAVAETAALAGGTAANTPVGLVCIGATSGNDAYVKLHC